MHEAGVTVPMAYHEMPTRYGDDKKFIFKPFHSHRGVGVELITDRANPQRPEGCYVQELVQKKAEYRAHVATWMTPKCFSIQQKKPKTEDMDGYVRDAKRRLCWNIANGWYLARLASPNNIREMLRESRILRDIADAATRAVEALGHDFGAVDLVMSPQDQLYVLEVNACPGVKGPSEEIYRTVFGILLEDGRPVATPEVVQQPATPEVVQHDATADTAARELTENRQLQQRVEELERQVAQRARERRVHEENEALRRRIAELENALVG